MPLMGLDLRRRIAAAAMVERCRPVEGEPRSLASVESWLLPLFRHSPPEALRGEPSLARAWFNKSLA